MAFWFKYQPTNRAAVPVLPAASTLLGQIKSTDIGSLITAGSSVLGEYGALPVGTTLDAGCYLGILIDDNGTTAGSTVPFYVLPIVPGNVLEANYSTTVERSTGVSIIATSNIGRYVGIGGGTTTVVLGKYIDPSLASTAPGTTNHLFFRMLGFSTQNDTVYGIINTSHLAV